MKLFLTSLTVLLLLFGKAYGQKVGIGTTSPAKLLSVNGSVMIDQGNLNSGSVDSAALRFGTASLVGLSSNRNAGFPNLNGIDFWTTGAGSTAGNVNINVVATTPSGAPCGGGSMATVRFSNPTSSTLNLGTNAKLYLYTVVTD